MSALLALILALAPGHDADGGREPAFVESVLRVPKDGAALALRDLDGDGALDLVRADSTGLALLGGDAAGRYSSEPRAHLAWPAGRVGWDLADLDGDGACEVVLVDGDGAVQAHRALPDGGFDEGRTVLEAQSYLPAGRTRARFVRDVDGDGRLDLVLPGPGAHRIHLATEEGWAPPIEVAYELDASYRVGNPESLSASFGQSVRVPWFGIEDVDGDGDDDLVARTRDRVGFHLADPTLSSEPTWVLDLVALRAELPRRRGVDLDDLFANIEGRVWWRLAELDGKPPRDLIVVLGSKLRMYLGGSRAGPQGDPDQVLKSSGTVLWSFVRQVEGDALPDLQLVRAERISVGRAVRSLILPSSIDFDLFTYRNEGGAFSGRPTRRNRVTIEVPRLLSLINDAEELEERIDEQLDVRARRLPRVASAPAVGDDVVDVGDEELLLYAGCAPEPHVLEDIAGGVFEPERFVEGYFLEELDAGGDGAERTLDLGDLTSFDFAPGALLRRACAGREPAERHPLAVASDAVTELLPRDLNGDGRVDVIVVGEDEDTDEWIVQLLVRAR